MTRRRAVTLQGDEASLPGPIAVVMTAAGTGGTELQLALLVRSLLAVGVDIDVFLLRGDLGTLDFGAAPVHLLGVGASRSPLGVLISAMRLWAALRRRPYRVVHAALAIAHVLAPLLSPGDVRIVVWRRNLGIHRRDGSLAAHAERLAARRVDAVLANSPSVAQYWASRGQTGREGVRVVANALEPWRFGVTTAAKVTHEVSLVTVGNLREAKGHDILLEAAAKLAAQGMDVGLVIVGEGPMGQDLARRARVLGVDLTLVAGCRDPRPWLASADVYVHPSRSEGASNAIAEAMAQGCIIVATRVGGAEWMLDDAGILVEPESIEDLTAGILRGLEPAASSLGAKARQRAEEQFSVEKVVTQHLAVYRGA